MKIIADYRSEHPNKPKDPGSDDDHKREDERDKERERVKKAPKRDHGKTRKQLHK